MDKAYDPKATEAEIYKLWEQGGYFVPKIDKTKEPFTILLPPPNANADLHLGHAMYVVEDILIRYHRMKGDPTLWLPGADHGGTLAAAGSEYEKRVGRFFDKYLK